MTGTQDHAAAKMYGKIWNVMYINMTVGAQSIGQIGDSISQKN
jgi:hypothetical protein